MMQLGHGIYKFLNRQSGTAMDMDGDSVVGMPPSLSETQKWEIQPLGDGFMIRNVKTQKYLSIRALFRTAPVIATSYPTAWHINKVYLPDENAIFYEIRWPHSGYLFDLAGGESTPKTKIQITDESHDTDPEQHRSRLWKALFFCSLGALRPTRPNHTTTTAYRTNPYTSAFNNTYTTAAARGANGAAKMQPRTTSAPPPLNTRAQHSTRPGSTTGVGNGHTNGIWHGNGSGNMYSSTYPAPAAHTASKTAGRPLPSAPGGQAMSSKAPMMGVGTVMGTAKTHAPGTHPSPSLRGSGGSASDRSSMGDSQRMSITSPATVYGSGTGTGFGGDMRYLGEDRGHAPMMEKKAGGTGGGGGVRGFIARLTGSKADKAGKSKDF
ncbi:hypothetical protein J3A83DRAFT_981381 [Scleroderma citrinum]